MKIKNFLQMSVATGVFLSVCMGDGQGDSAELKGKVPLNSQVNSTASVISSAQEKKLNEAQLRKAIKVKKTWARPAFKSKNTAAFMVIENNANVDVFLSTASCCKKHLARKVELHTHIMEGDIVRMRPVGVEGIKIPAKGSVALRRGGLHVMLIGLDEDVRLGRELKLNLLFKQNIKNSAGVLMRNVSFPIHSRVPE